MLKITKLINFFGCVTIFTFLCAKLTFADPALQAATDFYNCLKYQVKIEHYPAYDRQTAMDSIPKVMAKCPGQEALNECMASGASRDDCLGLLGKMTYEVLVSQ